jgi:hypothetical protein
MVHLHVLDPVRGPGRPSGRLPHRCTARNGDSATLEGSMVLQVTLLDSAPYFIARLGRLRGGDCWSAAHPRLPMEQPVVQVRERLAEVCPAPGLLGGDRRGPGGGRIAAMPTSLAIASIRALCHGSETRNALVKPRSWSAPAAACRLSKVVCPTGGQQLQERAPRGSRGSHGRPGPRSSRRPAG